MKKIICATVLSLLFASCHKSEAPEPTRHVVYITSGPSKDCHIEYVDYNNKSTVQLEHVPADFRYEFDIPAKDVLKRGYLNISIQDHVMPYTTVQAVIYINDTAQDNEAIPGYANAVNR